MSLIASNTVPPVTRLASPVATVPVPSFVAHVAGVVTFEPSAFAFPFTVPCNVVTVPCNVVNVLFVAKSIFDPSTCVVPLVILVTFVSKAFKAV